MINEDVLRSVLHSLTGFIYTEMKKGKTEKEKVELDKYEVEFKKLINEKLIEENK